MADFDHQALPQLVNNPQDWSLVIRPQRGLFDLRLGELWSYRDLVWLFVRRDFVSVYKQTILGPLWYLIQPVLTSIIFTVIFGRIARLSTDGLPQFLFYMSGTVVWTYFADCLTKTSNTFITNAQLFGKVYFPRLAVPVSILISNLIAFSIQFLLFLGFMLYFWLNGANVEPNLWVLFTPVLIVLMAGLGLGFGIIVSSLTTRYRDLRFLVTFGVQLWMFVTPVIYPVSAIPGTLATLDRPQPADPYCGDLPLRLSRQRHCERAESALQRRRYAGRAGSRRAAVQPHRSHLHGYRLGNRR
ncbi:MAG: ABC transporter permease [Anaerolineales bacterium]|nr:ABC transporter permease [Anaerolineales bacterium]